MFKIDNLDKVLEKLLDKTARKEIDWIAFSTFPTDDSLPYFGYQHLVPQESYLYSFGYPSSGRFYLATFKMMALENKVKTELILGFEKVNDDGLIISKDQKKLFELKALIEYEEPEKNISDILKDFLDDNE